MQSPENGPTHLQLEDIEPVPRGPSSQVLTFPGSSQFARIASCPLGGSRKKKSEIQSKQENRGSPFFHLSHTRACKEMQMPYRNYKTWVFLICFIMVHKFPYSSQFAFPIIGYFVKCFPNGNQVMVITLRCSNQAFQSHTDTWTALPKWIRPWPPNCKYSCQPQGGPISNKMQPLDWPCSWKELIWVVFVFPFMSN